MSNESKPAVGKEKTDNLDPTTIVGIWKSHAIADIPAYQLKVGLDDVVHLKDIATKRPRSWEGKGRWIDEIYLISLSGQKPEEDLDPLLVLSGFAYGGSKVAYGMLYIRVAGNIVRGLPVTFIDDPSGLFEFHNPMKTESSVQSDTRVE